RREARVGPFDQAHGGLGSKRNVVVEVVYRRAAAIWRQLPRLLVPFLGVWLAALRFPPPDRKHRPIDPSVRSMVVAGGVEPDDRKGERFASPHAYDFRREVVDGPDAAAAVAGKRVFGFGLMLQICEIEQAARLPGSRDTAEIIDLVDRGWEWGSVI